MNLKNFNVKLESLRELVDPKRIQREKKLEKKKGLAKGLALGTFIGGIVGIFFAPDKGKNTRRKTKEELERVKNILEANIAEGKVRLEDLADKKKEALAETITVLRDKINNDKKAAPFILQDEEEEAK
jgi:gas vesicle protein